MLKKKLIVHGGLHKTGSSSIQMSLFQNKEYLEHYGVSYPDEGLAFDEEIGYRHLYFSNLLKPHAFNKEKLLEIIQAFKEAYAHTIVVSHENLFRKDIDPEALELLHKHFDVSLVIFVKDPVIYFNDKYKEWVRRQECTLEPAEFILSHLDYLHWHQILPIWERIIGRNNIYVAEFSTLVKTSNALIDHFYAQLNSISTSNIDTARLVDVAKVNQSVNNAQILINLLSNKSGLPATSNSDLVASQLDSTKGLVLSRECVRQVKAKSWHALHYISAHYGCNVKMKKVDEYELDQTFSKIENRTKAIALLNTYS